MSAPKGIPHTAEHNAKISASLRASGVMREIGRRGGAAPHKPQTVEHIDKRMTSRAGYKHSPETRVRMSESAKRRGMPHFRHNTPNRLERALYQLLHGAGLEFVREHWIGHYRVDAFVPSHNLVFEADGAYWHQDQKREEWRDKVLRHTGIVAVIHLSEDDLRPFR